MNKDEALDLALEALEYWAVRDEFNKQTSEAITAIKQARSAPYVASPRVQDTEAHYKSVIEGVQKLFNDKRSQPASVQSAERGEPVAWIYSRGAAKVVSMNYVPGVRATPLYTTPPAAPVQEPNYWNVIDPAGNIVASETDAIRGWARIAGSYKPTVEGLLGFHDQGWRVLPKVSTSAAQRQWQSLTDEDIGQEFGFIDELLRDCVHRTEAKVREKNNG